MRAYRAAITLAAASGLLSGSLAGPGDRTPSAKVACANLVYAVDKTSVCFSDRFLRRLEMETKVQTEPRFARVRLDDIRQLCGFPFAIMTGEGGWRLTEKERVNLRYYVENGGFLVASAGCSDPEWVRSFRSEFARAFPGRKLARIPLSHPLFRTVYLIRTLETSQRRHGPQAAVLDGLSLKGRLVLVFSSDGLNDTAHAENCCCCGGDEIANAEFINVNLLAYALLH